MMTAFAYDWIGRNVYWSAVDELNVTSTARPEQQRTLFNKVAFTVSIALHPKAGMMYVGHKSSFDGPGGISAAWMDGSNRSVLITDLYRPSSLQVDTVEGHLYWIDFLRSRIERVRLNGTDRETVRIGRGQLAMPFSLALFEGNMFWSELHAIYRWDANETVPVRHMSSDSLATIRVYDPNSQLARPSEYEHVRCAGLVLATPRGLHCQCGDGYTLDASSSKCLPLPAPPALPASCAVGQFQCENSRKCIDKTLTCDGENDCHDGSDESAAPGGPCNVLSCQAQSLFTCADGKRCFRFHRLCDGVWNCADGSDETDDRCKPQPAPPCNNATEFRCKSGECIALSWKCDEQRDCLDGSDEWEDVCDTACPEFRCSSGKCLDFSQQCNGLDDCG